MLSQPKLLCLSEAFSIEGIMAVSDYWKECVLGAAADCGLVMTDEQAAYMADAVQGSHENYGLAFYSPPASDRLADIERGYKARIAALEQELKSFRASANAAVRDALMLGPDAIVSIGDNGEVYQHGGRTTRLL